MDFGTKDGSVHFAHSTRTKEGALAFPESYAEVSNCSNGGEDVRIKVATVVSPVRFLNTPMQGGEPLTHDCPQTIEKVCAG